MKKSHEFLKKLFGESSIERIENFAEQYPEIHSLVEHYATEKVWMREGLSLREKSLLTLSSQISQGDWDQVRNHMESFLNLGGTGQELQEICIHMSVYAGFPRMLKAAAIAREVLEGQAKPETSGN